MSWAYIVSSLVWSLVGFVLGRLTVNVEQIRRDMSDTLGSEPREEIPVSSAVPPSPRPRRVTVIRKMGWQQVVGIVVVFMALVSILLTAFHNSRLTDTIACQSAYNDAYSRALQARDAVNKTAREGAKDDALASKAMWKGLIASAPTEAGARPSEEQRAASLAVLSDYFLKVDRYVASIDEVGRTGQVFPIPDNLCPDPDLPS